MVFDPSGILGRRLLISQGAEAASTIIASMRDIHAHLPCLATVSVRVQDPYPG